MARYVKCHRGHDLCGIRGSHSFNSLPFSRTIVALSTEKIKFFLSTCWLRWTKFLTFMVKVMRDEIPNLWKNVAKFLTISQWFWMFEKWSHENVIKQFFSYSLFCLHHKPNEMLCNRPEDMMHVRQVFELFFFGICLGNFKTSQIFHHQNS